jgi:hypothetical protein
MEKGVLFTTASYRPLYGSHVLCITITGHDLKTEGEFDNPFNYYSCVERLGGWMKMTSCEHGWSSVAP